MSEILKLAAQLTPLETLLLGMAGGAGVYGIGRTLQNTLNTLHAPPKRKPNAVQLNFMDPLEQQQLAMSSPMTDSGGQGSAIPQISKAASNDSQSWGNWPMTPYLAGGLGLPAGFFAAKTVYDQMQAKQDQKHIDAAKQQYLATLQQAQMANQKMATETPSVDGFCEELAKQAALLSPGIPTGVDPAVWAHNQSVAEDNLANTAHQGGIDARNFFTGGASNFAGKAWEAVAAAAALGTLGTGIYFNNKKREREERAQYPTSVAYAQ